MLASNELWKNWMPWKKLNNSANNLTSFLEDLESN